MTDDRARFRLCSDVVTRDSPEGLILVNLDTGAAFMLDDVGAEICRRLDGNADFGQIRAAIESMYEVSADVLSGHLETLLDELQSAGLVEAAS